ncbi:zincin-like metallopeptidase domain-containing protein [Chryseobacterium nematophagum]|uniref:zincin-like metallopeptidase domain-containing protein n=1 Tax=Chryseobacterium nematophagum TaxID=2305228 RepID=UPI0021D1A046|nr:zincin-like metallopeptidase domain-containing protein [Chryseobacterium nematophagum]
MIKIPCLKNYVVFNSEFIDNLEEINLSIIDEEPQEYECNEIVNCEVFISKIIEKGNLKLRFSFSEVAFYTPTFDYVEMPKKEIFISTSKYYSALFHEVIHWTGHTSRLDRNLKGHKDKESYSFEELIAEMGSMLCCLQFGILDEFLNSIRYLKGWSTKNLLERETNLRNAFSESKKAKKFLEQL